MIPEFVQGFQKRRDTIKNHFLLSHPGTYDDIVKFVVGTAGEEIPDGPDVERMAVVRGAENEGSDLFIIPDAGYSGGRYWLVFVDYGSCSGCDTLKSIRDDCDCEDLPTEDQASRYMTLALHIIQNIRLLNDRDPL